MKTLGVQENQAEAEIASLPQDEAYVDRLLATADIRENTHMHADNQGDDAFIASVKEVPGTLVVGPTADAARHLLREALIQDFASADEQRRNRLALGDAHVQLNFRITPDEKIQIVRRAIAEGVSTRKFMLNQCLRAPVFRDPPRMPRDDKEKMWREAAKSAKAKEDKPAAPAD